MNKPIRKSGVVVEKTGQETLLYGTEREEVHVLNATAELIWDICDGEHTIADIEAAIRGQFTVGEDVDVLGDVQQTLHYFSSKQLLE